MSWVACGEKKLFNTPNIEWHLEDVLILYFLIPRPLATGPKAVLKCAIMELGILEAKWYRVLTSD